MAVAGSVEEAAFDAPELRDARKRSASALKRDSVPFALAGSYALWVHGAPEPVHDVDLAVSEEEVEAAADSLTAAGFQVERPPEDWPFKAPTEGAMVDVLHRIQGTCVDAALLERAEELEVLGVRIPVLPATEIVTAKLQSLSEHYADFGALLPMIRALREQRPVLTAAIGRETYAGRAGTDAESAIEKRPRAVRLCIVTEGDEGATWPG